MIQVEQIVLREIRLPLVEPFQISSGTTTERRILLIEAIDKSGAVMLLQKCLRVDPKNARATALMRQLIDESAAKAPAAAGPAAAAKNKVDKR